MNTHRNPTSSAPASRRAFLQKTTAAAGGLFLGATLCHDTSAAEPAPAVPNETIKTIHGLRTTHGNFNERDVPEDQLNAILQAAMRAANASNMQNYSIVVVRERDAMKALCGYRGSRALVFCADHTRMMASAAALGHTYAANEAASFLTATIDTALVAQTAVIAARSLGIDTLLTNGIHRGDMSRMWKLLDLPERQCFPIIALVLGYPTQEPGHRKGRLDGPGIIHDGKYRRPTDEDLTAIARQYDDPGTHLALNEEWSKGGHKHYFDWLFTAWIGRSPRPPGQASQMLELLKRSGYLDA